MQVIRDYPTEILIRQNAYYPLDLMRGLTEFYLGDRQQAESLFYTAIGILEDRVANLPEDPRVFSALGMAYAGTDSSERAIEAAQAAYELYPVSMDAVDGALYVLNYAKTLAMLNQTGDAVEKLDELLSRPSPWYATLNVILRDPAFASLRDDAGFVSLVEKHRAGD